MADRHLIRTSTNILCIRHGKILLSRRQNTGWSDGLLCIPGGHVEAGETPTQAAVREVEEELGLTVSAEDLKLYCVAQRKTPQAEYVAYEFCVELNENQKPINAEPELCEELAWVDPANLPKDVITDFAQIITKGYLNKEIYLEIGYD